MGGVKYLWAYLAMSGAACVLDRLGRFEDEPLASEEHLRRGSTTLHDKAYQQMKAFHTSHHDTRCVRINMGVSMAFQNKLDEAEKIFTEIRDEMTQPESPAAAPPK